MAPDVAAQHFTAAADEVRRVLHQFAAGFLTEPSPVCLARLASCLPVADISDRAVSPSEPLMGPPGEPFAQAVALPQAGPSPSGYLQDVVELQAGVQQALERLSQFRPSKVPALADLEDADRAFDSAWAEAAERLAACERVLQTVLKRL